MHPTFRLSRSAWWLALAGLIFGWPQPSRGAGQKHAAVLEFELAPGATGVDRIYFSDRARTAVHDAAPQLFVMTRESTEALLQANGKSMADCTGECEVEVGRKLGADYIVSGRIAKIGSRTSISMRLFSTADGQLLSSAEARGKTVDELQDQLDAALAKLLAPLSGAAQASELPRPKDSAPAGNAINATPPGAFATGAKTKTSGAGASGCPDGQVETAGRCCYPGQDWGASRQACIGAPRCPQGMVANGDSCACESGRLVVADHCCWPGQDWGVSRRACIGAPACPEEMTLENGGCTSNEVIAERQRKAAEAAQREAEEATRAKLAAEAKATDDLRASFEGRWECDPSYLDRSGALVLTVIDSKTIRATGDWECGGHNRIPIKASVREARWSSENGLELEGDFEGRDDSHTDKVRVWHNDAGDQPQNELCTQDLEPFCLVRGNQR